jgi:hypothetical protein
MKTNIGLIAVAIILLTAGTTIAQNINWRSLEASQKHVINVNVGIDNSASFGIGYGWMFSTKLPLMLNTEFSLPSGKNLIDDFKLKIGGQSEVLKLGNFSATVKAFGIIRRYQSEFVRLWNFGSEFSAVTGYYKPRWHVAGEFGFDKAISTHVANSDELKKYYPTIRDGWYVPTGGNYFYGIQSGLSFKKMDTNIRIGKTIAQGFETSALFPYYLQVGVNRRF